MVCGSSATMASPMLTSSLDRTNSETPRSCKCRLGLRDHLASQLGEEILPELKADRSYRDVATPGATTSAVHLMQYGDQRNCWVRRCQAAVQGELFADSLAAALRLKAHRDELFGPVVQDLADDGRLVHRPQQLALAPLQRGRPGQAGAAAALRSAAAVCGRQPHGSLGRLVGVRR